MGRDVYKYVDNEKHYWKYLTIAYINILVITDN